MKNQFGLQIESSDAPQVVYNSIDDLYQYYIVMIIILL